MRPYPGWGAWWWWVIAVLLVALAVGSIVYRANTCVGGDRPWWC